jgi:hypothetical protein
VAVGRQQADEEPLDLGDGSEEALVAAVLAHYRARLFASGSAESVLSPYGISESLARTYGLGLSDRTLGLRLPERNRSEGRVLREMLIRLGLYRKSGHEHLSGCLVVPITAPSGEVVGVLGSRLQGGDTLYAKGLAGGIFGARPETTDKSVDHELIVTAGVLDALLIAGCGRRAVAAGRPGGFTASDLDQLARSEGSLTCVGGGGVQIADALSDRGAKVRLTSYPGRMAELLASGTSRNDALTAFVATALPHRSAKSKAVLAEAVAAPAAVASDAGADEIYLAKNGRSWRVRGARAAAERPECLRVICSVTDSASGRFHLDSLDLYLARQRRGFLDAAATELCGDSEVLALELAEVLAAAEQERDRAGTTTAARVELSAADRSEALSFLTCSDLVGELARDLGSLGVVGEETNLVQDHRKLPRPDH